MTEDWKDLRFPWKPGASADVQVEGPVVVTLYASVDQDREDAFLRGVPAGTTYRHIGGAVLAPPTRWQRFVARVRAFFRSLFA